MQGKPISEQEIGKQLLQEVVAYAEASVCRRKFLLHYFGEDFNAALCKGACDNCRFPKKKEEAKEEMTMVLQTVVAIKEKFKMKHVVNILMGVTGNTITSYKHDTLDMFGAGTDKNEKYWESMIRQGLLAGFLTKDIENYGLLKISASGLAFIKKPVSFLMTLDHDFDAEPNEDDIASNMMKGGGGAFDDVLLKMLKELRKDISKEEGLPPFVIFQDPSLEDMALRYPITLDELKDITGVGVGKAKKFGEPFIELIREYVEENEIEREQDMVVRSIAKKSSNKVHIIQSIDRKLDLEDIAEAKGLEIDELLTEIEHILASGTNINLNYYIDKIIDEDKQEEVYEYFKEAKTDSIQDALRELGENIYTEEEMRLMRIKFMSEYGN
jgi:ATP-dependent DNA helicase RecQ